MYYASEKEIEKLDDLAVVNGLQIRQMMELAGWQMVTLFNILKLAKNEKVVIVCGKGNKAGDGLSAARHLINHGYQAKVILVDTNLKPDPKHHLELLAKMGGQIISYKSDRVKAEKLITEADVIIDALIGYHLQDNPRSRYAAVINFINNLNKKVIAYDIPTGIDATTGKCRQPCINSWVTLTLAIPKRAVLNKAAKKMSGRVYLADIGIPGFLYDKVAENSRPNFTSRGIVKIK